MEDKKDIQQTSAPGKKMHFNQRRARIIEFLQQIGSWMIPRAVASQLSRELGVSERQIYLDRKTILKTMALPDVKETSAKFLINWDFVMLQVQTLIRDQEPKVKSRGIDLYFKSMETYTRFLESYGFKEKIEEKLNISGDELSEEKMIKILDKYIK